MNTPRIFAITLALVGILNQASPVAAETLNWRGVLQDGAAPAQGRYDLQLRLHSARSGGKSLSAPLIYSGVEVKDGKFELPIELSALEDQQPELWLEVAARAVGEASFETLPERSLAKGALSCWSTSGNAGTNIGAGAFIGTTDDVGFQIKVNNKRVAGYYFFGNPALSPILISGHEENISLNSGAVIAGGGQANLPNIVASNYSTISGGFNNTAGNFEGALSFGATIGGGYDNVAEDRSTTVGGGESNSAINVFATVAGGSGNNAEGTSSTISGGDDNSAIGVASVIGGGRSNSAGALYATIPGGSTNTASGQGAFAAGRGAQALHEGAFVWSGDFTGISSTAARQIRLRAEGGMQLQTDNVGVSAADLGSADAVDLVIESTDAQAYLMSDNVGSIGSVIGMGEMSGNALVNTWAIARETTGGGSGLRFAFGTDPVAATNPVKVEFQSNGQVFKASGTASWDVVSDARLKHELGPIDSALERLLQLRGVRFEYNAASLPGGIELPEGEQLGFIAQEVQKVFPEWVGETQDGYLYIGERGTTALLVEALRELNDRNAALEQRLAALEKALLSD